MNDVFSLLQSHRSIRKFTDQPIDQQLLHDLILCGQGAASSSFLQGVSVIRVTDEEKRNTIMQAAANQQYIESCAEFLVFCADLSRSSRCCEWHNEAATEGFTEQFIIATVDVALFAQNVVVAAEASGLGICYIGAIRNDPTAVSETLNLPDNVYPVFGLCLGYPAQDPEVKPRLPLNVVLKQNEYGSDDERGDIETYDQTVRAYYQTRTGGKKDMTWSEQMAGLLSNERRLHMRDFLKSKGFEMK